MRFPTFATVATLVATLPAAAIASTASFSWFAGVDVTIDAPGATIVVLEDSFAVGDAFADGAASASLTASPFDPGTFDASDFDLEASADGHADPLGGAFAFGFAELLIDVINETGDDIIATVSWDISAEATAEVSPTPFTADALADVFLGFVAETESGAGPVVDEEVSAFADALFGPFSDIDGSVNSETWTLAPEGVISLKTEVFAGGFATVVPVPPAIAFLLTGVAGLALMRRRSA